MNDRPSPLSNYSPPQEIDAGKVNRELERVLKSQAFRNAPLLQRFLTYVTQKALEGHAEDIKEYSIATEVMNRSSDFDPKLSPLVRVEAHRLRDRLTQYYASEGSGDGVIFHIPKGGYVPTFVFRSNPASRPVEEPESNPSSQGEMNRSDAEIAETAEEQVLRGPPAKPRRLRYQWLVLGVAAALGVTAYLLFTRRATETPRPVGATQQGRSDTPLQPDALILTLWSNLLGNARTAYVFYWDRNLASMSEGKGAEGSKGGADQGVPLPAQEGSEANENRPYVTDGLLSFDNAFAAAGEVQGVYALTRLLVRIGIPIEVHGCQSLPTESISQHSVILLGPDLEQQLRSSRPTPENFVFESVGPQGGPKRRRILNLHPLEGEQKFYETQRDAFVPDTVEDWAILSVLPGIRQQRKTIIMGGLTHTGTEGVTEFCVSGTGAVTILDRLGVGEDEKTLPPFYQVLLRVTIKQGSIIDIAFVSARVIPGAG